MFTYIQDAIAEIIAAYKKRKEEEEAARRFRKTCTAVLTCAGVLCLGLAGKKLIGKLLGTE